MTGPHPLTSFKLPSPEKATVPSILHDNPVPGDRVIFKYPHSQLPSLQDPIGLPGVRHMRVVSDPPPPTGPAPGDAVPPRKAQGQCGEPQFSLGALNQLSDIFPNAVPILIGCLVAHHEDPLVGVDGWEASLGHCMEQGMGQQSG